MAIHVTWKEIAARLGDITALERIAEVLSVGDATVPIVYFEFESPEQLSYFCKAVKMMPFVHEMDVLKQERDRLIEENSKLADILEKTRKKAIKKGIVVAASEPPSGMS